MVGVWIDPVTAQVTMTFWARRIQRLLALLSNMFI